MNLGIGGDRTQHVIWRMQNGNLDGINPELAVVMIGTNNAGSDSSRDIANGVEKITSVLLEKLPNAEILLLGIFPRGENAENRYRLINEGANEIFSRLQSRNRVHYLDIGSNFLSTNGGLSKEGMPDLLHLNEGAYRTWAESIEPMVRELLQEDAPPAAGQPAVGYRDTPLIPGTEWHVHDSQRPSPNFVQPGTGTSAPSDAIVLFNGTGLDKWASSSVGLLRPWRGGNGPCSARPVGLWVFRPALLSAGQ